ncbi:polysaccharide biosynthesis tyrosine autokinase [Phyllobacterium zundukense]|uniref:non-specific protein-tyrosine kinase n=1 Tax=Phyllobacterium zundukense TaxID=1867719 RepID=A0A2N9VQS3_9HYPH|nr:polysaccharide biosynthesis tyrosine autokinase [Phyllobacterium zundukense]ATU92277.1 chain-length determining protein [Phyllobacterium zundukense]PIO41841.1 chain-length determining protein [Phyllobacterium zundukense]
MHQANIPFSSRIGVSSDTEHDADDFIDIERLITIARRQAKVLAVGAGIGLLLGIIYIIVATPNYTASTSILLDDSLGKFADDVSPAPSNMQSDTTILSQIAILKSAELATKVVIREKLDENEVFMNPPRSLASRVKSVLRTIIGLFGGGRVSDVDLTNRDARIGYAASLLENGLYVERQGRSFVIDLTYTSNDDILAGKIAKAYADAYLSDQLDANFDATERATIWLQARLKDLQESSQAAALEVERFRAANGLTAAKGALVSEQQLSDINSQLILAQADTARALALYNQFKTIVSAGPDEAVKNASVVTDQNGTSVIETLRTRYLSVSKREQEIVARFGQDHPQAVSLRSEKQDLGKQIFQELKQMTESYRNQYEVAQSRETSLRQGLGKVTGETSSANEALVHLKELEQNSEALSNLYKTFLTRYQEASQQQSFPIAKARVISIASTPSSPSSPNRTMVLVLSVLLGTFAGMGVGAWREFRERFFRVGDDVRAVLGLKFLGYVPAFHGPADHRSPRGMGPVQAPAAASLRITRMAVENPSSLFAETLRNAQIAADVVLHGQRSKVLGVISVLPNEGKSTVAANFANLLAVRGSRTLLIDADLRNPGLTRSLSLSPQRGLVQAVLGKQPWQNSVKIDKRTKLELLPAVLHKHFQYTSELLSSEAMRKLLEEARSIYDYIVVDLPPLGPVVDAKAFAPLADGFIMVAEWGATPRALVRSVLQSETHITPKVLGLILNKTDMKELAKYTSYGSSEHFMERYTSYYLNHTQSTTPKPKTDGEAANEQSGSENAAPVVPQS